MAFTGQTNHGRTREFEPHIVAFDGTDETVEVKTELKVITGVVFGHLSAHAANDALRLDETVSDFGQVNTPSGGKVTVRRPANGTSGLIFSMFLTGI